jgi:hypothetical protein
MALDHADRQRERARQGMEDVDPYLAVLLTDVDGREIAVALGITSLIV